MADIGKLAQLAVAALVLAVTVTAGDQPKRKPITTMILSIRRSPRNLHGNVKFKLWINPDRTVRRVEYVGGHPLLAESALKAVKSWTYETSPKESTSVAELKF